MDATRPRTSTAMVIAVLAALCAFAAPSDAHAAPGRSDPPAASSRAEGPPTVPASARASDQASTRPAPSRNERASGPPAHANAAENRGEPSVSTSGGSNSSRTAPRTGNANTGNANNGNGNNGNGGGNGGRGNGNGGGNDGPGNGNDGSPGPSPDGSTGPDRSPTSPSPSPAPGDDPQLPGADADEPDEDPDAGGLRTGPAPPSAPLLGVFGSNLVVPTPAAAAAGLGATTGGASAAVLGPATTTPVMAAVGAAAPSIVAPATGLVQLPDGSATRAAEALAERTRAAVRGLPDAALPPRDLGVPAALLALLGMYLGGLRWLDRGGLPMAHLDERRGDDVHLVL